MVCKVNRMPRVGLPERIIHLAVWSLELLERNKNRTHEVLAEVDGTEEREKSSVLLLAIPFLGLLFLLLGLPAKNSQKLFL